MNVGDLSKLIFAKGFIKLPKVQKIAKSGHTGSSSHDNLFFIRSIRSSNIQASFNDSFNARTFGFKKALNLNRRGAT